MATERERFNWGFWTGINAQKQTHHLDGITFALNSTHFDKVWAAGVRAGYYTDGQPERSDEAWALFTTERKQRAAERKALRDMRPMRLQRF